MQGIPLGAAGSAHAVRRGRPPRRAARVRALPAVLAALGVAAAGSGLALYLAEPQVEVRMDAAGYHLAGLDLASQGGDTYQGADGGALVVQRQPGQVVAAASATVAGGPMLGRCTLATAAGEETCQFTIGGRSLAATDTRTATGWERRYSDGQGVAIRVDGDPNTPVPFPVGR